MSNYTFTQLFRKGQESLNQWQPQAKRTSEAAFDVIDFSVAVVECL